MLLVTLSPLLGSSSRYPGLSFSRSVRSSAGCIKGQLSPAQRGRPSFSPAFLTMPKVQSSRRSRKQSSTDERRARAAKIESRSLEMVAKCSRCKEKGLRCFVDTASGQCAGCIAVKAECSLFVSDEEWEKVQREKRQKRLEIARLKAQLAQTEVELLEAEAREHSFADRDLAVLKELDSVKEQVEGNSAPGTDLPVVEPSLSGPSADLG